jgi:acetyl-CoA/propionyl-CoA carboxylase biotin carboxyl carrier protein
VRVDSGVAAGSEVTPLYDPLVAKLIVWDADRERATARMLRALGEYEIGGLVTLVPFHRAILATEQWRNAETCRDLLGDRKWLKSLEPSPEASSAAPAAPAPDQGAERVEERVYQVEVDGRLHSVKVIGVASANPAPAAGLHRPPRRERVAGGAAAGSPTETLVSPIQGTVLKVPVKNGDQVEEGALICVVEAMKMENEITAHRSGKISELAVKEGGSVAAGDAIAKIE